MAAAPSLHSITSSAGAMSVGGIATPMPSSWCAGRAKDLQAIYQEVRDFKRFGVVDVDDEPTASANRPAFHP